MNIIITIITVIVFAYQFACIGIVIYGNNNKNRIPQEDVEKYDKQQLICCFIIIGLTIFSLLF